MDENTGKSVSKNVSSKYSIKRLSHIRQSAIDAFNTTSKVVILKTAEATGEFICNKIASALATCYTVATLYDGDNVTSTESQINPETALKRQKKKQKKKQKYLNKDIYLQKKDNKLLLS